MNTVAYKMTLLFLLDTVHGQMAAATGPPG